MVKQEINNKEYIIITKQNEKQKQNSKQK